MAIKPGLTRNFRSWIFLSKFLASAKHETSVCSPYSVHCFSVCISAFSFLHIITTTARNTKTVLCVLPKFSHPLPNSYSPCRCRSFLRPKPFSNRPAYANLHQSRDIKPAHRPRRHPQLKFPCTTLTGHVPKMAFRLHSVKCKLAFSWWNRTKAVTADQAAEIL